MSIAAILAFARTWWPALLFVLVAAPLVFLLGQCDGRGTERAEIETKTVKAQLGQEKRDRAADANLNQARQIQDAAIAADRKDVNDATAAIPDAMPSPRQRARACLELRRQARARAAPEPAC